METTIWWVVVSYLKMLWLLPVLAITWAMQVVLILIGAIAAIAVRVFGAIRHYVLILDVVLQEVRDTLMTF